jgi:hypothetical protein
MLHTCKHRADCKRREIAKWSPPRLHTPSSSPCPPHLCCRSPRPAHHAHNGPAFGFAVRLALCLPDTDAGSGEHLEKEGYSAAPHSSINTGLQQIATTKPLDGDRACLGADAACSVAHPLHVRTHSHMHALVMPRAPAGILHTQLQADYWGGLCSEEHRLGGWQQNLTSIVGHCWCDLVPVHHWCSQSALLALPCACPATNRALDNLSHLLLWTEKGSPLRHVLSSLSLPPPPITTTDCLLLTRSRALSRGCQDTNDLDT